MLMSVFADNRQKVLSVLLAWSNLCYQPMPSVHSLGCLLEPVRRLHEMVDVKQVQNGRKPPPPHVAGAVALCPKTSRATLRKRAQTDEVAAKLIEMQDVLVAALRDKAGELSLTTPQHQELLDHLFDATVDVSDEETFLSYRQTRSKAIVSCADSSAAESSSRVGDSKYHQDWCASGTLVLALSFSDGCCGASPIAVAFAMSRLTALSPRNLRMR